jgi:hypothetical protein
LISQPRLTSSKSGQVQTFMFIVTPRYFCDAAGCLSAGDDSIWATG